MSRSLCSAIAQFQAAVKGMGDDPMSVAALATHSLFPAKRSRGTIAAIGAGEKGVHLGLTLPSFMPAWATGTRCSSG